MEVSLKILNSGIILKTFTHACSIIVALSLDYMFEKSVTSNSSTHPAQVQS